MDNIDVLRLRRLDLNSLAALHALLSTRSVSQSAERLCLGQPAVSHILKKLRQQCGDPLLCRYGRRLERTPFADALLPRLEAWLQEAQRLLDAPVFDPAGLEGVYRLAMPDLLEAALLPELIASLQTQAPGLRLEGMAMPAAAVEEALAAGKIDGAIGHFPALSGRLSRQLLFHSRFVCLHHPARLTLPARLDAQQLAEPPHVYTSYAGNSASLVDDYLRGHGLERRVIASTASLLAIPLLLARLPAVAVLPDLIVEALGSGAGLRISPLDDAGLSIAVEHVWHPRGDSDALRLFIHRLLWEQTRRLAAVLVKI
ncbi:LysR family transcriptional regulator [Chromobacterium sp. IIBBL 290-4]|uniref:LysR family transcriptional regulator n=1 Tax=Chromobacterium sp. IIBBL 290-4 TaxID=2953890 RepID=UPI0020B8B5A8|nr:LysR family transcriptional regulator [Chromobacterium sp. IIBBL 290-4]UTH74980.1 LysR family transcriptional regulator [Chromobacterium sp. IIBBL 290-4]